MTVILNGIKIIDNGEVPGITGGALDADKKEAGPIMPKVITAECSFGKCVLLR